MAMSKKNIENGKVVVNGKVRAARYPNDAKISKGSSTPTKGEQSPQRLSPVRVYSPSGSLGSSPRTSPGLLAGHYAGCKFSEPPLPSALPLPPLHWMQAPRSTVVLPFHSVKSEQQDIAQQLMVLLKVQA